MLLELRAHGDRASLGAPTAQRRGAGPVFSWSSTALPASTFVAVESIDLHAKVGQQTKVRCGLCNEEIEGMPLMQDGQLRHWECIDKGRKWEAPTRLLQWWQSPSLFRWFLDIFIGAAVALCAWLVHDGHERLSSWRMWWTSWAMGPPPVYPISFFTAWLMNTFLSAAFVLAAVCLCEWQPSAASSGIPGVIAFLNGIDLKEKLFSGGVLTAKLLGVILACGSALAVGPEGPMIHIGATVGVLVHNLLLKLWPSLRSGRALELHAAAVGAGCGITAAFRAPIAGLLFVVEEATGYSSMRFYVHVFGAGCVSLALASLPALLKKPGLQYTALFQVSTGANCSDFHWLHWQYLACCCCIGLVCGGLGCVFNAIVLRLNQMRQAKRSLGPGASRRYFFLEALLLSILSTSVAVFLPSNSRCLESTVQQAFRDSNQCIQAEWADQIFHGSWEGRRQNPVPGLFGLQYNPVDCPKVLYNATTESLAANCDLRRRGLVFPEFVEEPQRYNYCCGFDTLESFKQGKVYSIKAPAAPFTLEPEAWPAFGCEEQFNEENKVWIPHYNPMAALAFVPGRMAIKNIFTRGSPHLLPKWCLFQFLPFYFLLAATTSGAAVPSGLVVPMMLIGGCTGRLLGLVLDEVMNDHSQCSSTKTWIQEFDFLLEWLDREGLRSRFVSCSSPDPGACAVVGAAAFMSGSGSIVLVSIAILVEITGDITFVLPIALGAVFGRLVVRLSGRHGLYHELMGVARFPFLTMRSHVSDKVLVVDALVDDHGLDRPAKLQRAQEQLQHFQLLETARAIRKKLVESEHHGFPVVHSDGRLAGLVRRGDLEAELHSRGGPPGMREEPEGAVESGPEIDLARLMDAAPYVVRDDFPIQRAHHIFSNLWLRHLVVVNQEHKPVGVLTRRSFAKMQQSLKMR